MRGEPLTIDVPPLSLRAEVSSFNADDRTADLIFSTGAAVDRVDWMTGTRYVEKLDISEKAIRMDRLNAGAPLLDSHSSWSISDQIGAVVPGSARIEKGKAVATVRFSARESVAPILGDVKDGIVRSVSVGYRVHTYEEIEGKGKQPLTRIARDWEPFEVSLVSMPADTGARVREGETGQTNRCVITRQQEPIMKNDETRQDGLSETIVEHPVPSDEPRMRMADEDPAQPETTPAEVAQKAERERVQGILLACRAAKMPSSMFDRLVGDGTPLVDAQKRIFEELSRRVDPVPHQPDPRARRVEMGDDPFVHKRAGIENALLHRVAPEYFKLEDVGREYRGLTMLDVARVYLSARGARVTGMNKMELAGEALGLIQRGGMHTTSDFPLLLADVAQKSLLAQYQASPQTFQPITRPGTLADYKAANRVRLGDAPALRLVNEHGEFQRGTIAESREQIQAASYGVVFAITRRALVNDDTDAFSRVPAQFGRAARNLESDLVWYQILSNPTMGDSVALFAAGHSNYSGAGLISITTMSAAETAMLLQTGLDGTTPILAQPRYLIVPPSLKTKALQFVSVNMQASQASNVNPFAGNLTVIAEPRLELGISIPGITAATGSATAWYIASAPDQIDIIELAMLEGQSGPLIESRVGFDIDGLEIKCRHDIGAKVLDHRGLYKNDGSAES